MNKTRPNILFVMSDDHASHAMSCYGSKINKTPNMDRIAEGGMRFDNCFCTNSICTPSRASILTGTYNHINGVTTLETPMDNRLQTFPKLMQNNGYQTAIFGKWHLGTGANHCPTGFDDWAVLPGQGRYHNPIFIFKDDNGGAQKTVPGYATDIITDMTINWLRQRDQNRPFCLLCHHKAPHRPWYPDEKHANMFLNEHIPEPATLCDNYENRASAASAAHMRVGVHMQNNDLKSEIPIEMPEYELRQWAYQRYIKDYLRVVASIDDNIGRLLDYLNDAGLENNTLVIYTSDQGFFLGDHGWYDKRFMYEESLRMPFILKYPEEVKPGMINTDMILNIDFAPLFLDLAGINIPAEFQGRSLRPLLRNQTPADWRQAMYYRYWMHKDKCHNVFAHYGIRTDRYKLIRYRIDTPPCTGGAQTGEGEEWELFDLQKDPCELKNIFNDPARQKIVMKLQEQLRDLQLEVGDEP